MAEKYFTHNTFESVIGIGEGMAERKKICGCFLYQDTTTLLFSRTNYGKSLLVFQFAYAAATGTHFDSCSALMNECDPLKTLVVDLELDPRTIYERHRVALQNKNPYLSNLVYLHEKVSDKMLIGFPLLEKIEEDAIELNAQVVIIDNISKLLPDALKPDTASFVIAMLNRIRIKTGATILVIGHTTKGNPSVCIQPTDYYGSSMLQNFFNELYFLDRTKTDEFFLCHSKTKHAENYMTTVPTFTRGLHPRFGVGFQYNMLQDLNSIQLPSQLQTVASDKHRNLPQYKSQMLTLISDGLSVPDLANMCGCSSSYISRILRSS